MKKVQRRSYIALILAFLVMAGLGVFLWRYAVDGRSWVSFSANGNLYRGGTLLSGTVTDRSGLVLADSDGETRTYADDPETRIACLHAVGDAAGNIGTGALSQFADRLTGYSPVTGVGGDGGTVVLSIDAQLQRTAWEALAGRRGAVLLADYSTGEILCMVSSPGYDPAVGFPEGDPAYDGVYLNRCLSVSYPPGSVFKLVTLAAAVDTIPELSERRFFCSGSVTVDGNVVHCTGIHGEQTVEQAFANSCNCAFAALSLELGGDTLERYAAKLGLTGPLRVSGIPCVSGRFDAAEDGSAALAWSGIGQSTDLVCPAALLRLVCAVGNEGRAKELTLLAGAGGSSERLLSADTAKQLKAMMNYNVATVYGQGNFPGLRLCAKSGTAELGDGSSHAWFTGFLDDPEHPYAFAVVVERGGGGARVAGPVANAVLQKATELKENE